MPSSTITPLKGYEKLYDEMNMCTPLPSDDEELRRWSKRSLKVEVDRAVKISRAILDRAKKENRQMTAEEGAEMKRLDGDLDRLEDALTSPEQRSAGIRPEISNQRGTVSHITTEGGPMLWTDRDTGRELRSYSLRRGESLRDAFATPEGSERAPHLGRMIIGSLRNEFPKEWEAEKRAVQIGTATQGGFVVPEGMGQVVPLAAANSVVLQAGAQVLEMPTGILKLGRQIADPAANWYEELPAALSLTDPTFGQFELNARTLAIRTLCSVQWIEDALNGPQLIEQAVARSLGLALDSAIMNGIPGGQWPGLRYYDEVNQVTMGASDGAQLTTFAPFVDAIKKVLEANYTGPLDRLTAVMAPRVWATIEGLTEATTNAPLVGPPSYNGLKKIVSTQLPINEVQGSSTDASTVYVGDFTQALVAMRTPIRIEATRTGGDAWKRLGVEVRGYVRLDWAFLHPAHFTRIVGVRA